MTFSRVIGGPGQNIASGSAFLLALSLERLQQPRFYRCPDASCARGGGCRRMFRSRNPSSAPSAATMVNPPIANAPVRRREFSSGVRVEPSWLLGRSVFCDDRSPVSLSPVGGLVPAATVVAVGVVEGG